eukprot:CAMPEP_0170489578 /NCGR_PEP_ID=MMETSP0208-20121228/7915_1 /TAXON_ID=197538 /ORGANISM="Strombidium inclinatum, Strain S3" /LENGTH=342 /DNA_ID=CAMNT_0010764565 /DNA_START=154 /DNA_END=1182 /DNA_ORIENTATION=-
MTTTEAVSEEEDEDMTKNVEELIRTKFNIVDIKDVEINSGYKNNRFGDLFTIRGLLGVGAFGIVLEVLNHQSMEITALKVIAAENSKTLFQTEPREQQVLQELKHKNIIILKAGAQLELPCIHRDGKNLGWNSRDLDQKEQEKAGSSSKSLLAKYMPGGKQDEALVLLQEQCNSAGTSPVLIRSKPKVLPEEVASSITKDLCNGLFSLHKNNFIHRDLKPENILVDVNQDIEGMVPEKFTAKITDFGLSAEVEANIFRASDNMNEVMGTILYMAPEQATGQRYGKRIDLWALGIIVFKMLTGKHPFYLKDDTEDSYINRISKQSLDKTLQLGFEKYDVSPLA